MNTDAVAAKSAGRASGRKAPSEGLLYALIAVMVWFWSLNYIVGKVALREFPPLLLGGLRTALAGIMILPMYFWNSVRTKAAGAGPHWTRRDVPMLLFLGLLGVALNQLFFVEGLSRTSVAHASILAGVSPIMVLLIAAGMGLERITRAKLAGMGIALAGIAVLNAPRSQGAPATLFGDFLIVLGGLAFAIFAAVGKLRAGRYGSLTVSTFAYAGGAVMLAPLIIWQSANFSYRAVSLAGWASLLYMAAFPSVLCYLIFYYALTYIPASRVSAFSYLQPLIATVLAVPLLGEPISGPLTLGGGLVFAGVYVAERG